MQNPAHNTDYWQLELWQKTGRVQNDFNKINLKKTELSEPTRDGEAGRGYLWWESSRGQSRKHSASGKTWPAWCSTCVLTIDESN